MSSIYDRRCAAFDRARRIATRRVWSLDTSLPHTGEALHLARNWIGCDASHPKHNQYRAIVERLNMRCDRIFDT